MKLDEKTGYVTPQLETYEASWWEVVCVSGTNDSYEEESTDEWFENQ